MKLFYRSLLFACQLHKLIFVIHFLNPVHPTYFCSIRKLNLNFSRPPSAHLEHAEARLRARREGEKPVNSFWPRSQTGHLGRRTVLLHRFHDHEKFHGVREMLHLFAVILHKSFLKHQSNTTSPAPKIIPQNYGHISMLVLSKHCKYQCLWLVCFAPSKGEIWKRIGEIDCCE